MVLLLLLGIYDDLRGAKPRVKFAGLALIAVLFYVLGGRIEALSIPGLGSVDLPSIISFLLTVFWLVGIANAFNLIDGVDGLASGAALLSSIVILAVSFNQGAVLMIVVALVLCGALAGFLRYNFNPASIFLGDSGALFIGFMLASLSVLGAQKATTSVAIITPVLAFGLPVVDYDGRIRLLPPFVSTASSPDFPAYLTSWAIGSSGPDGSCITFRERLTSDK